MPRKPPVVLVTNSAVSRLPSQRGEFVSKALSPEPIRPVQTPRHRQITAGPKVRFTDGRKSV